MGRGFTTQILCRLWQQRPQQLRSRQRHSGAPVPGRHDPGCSHTGGALRAHLAPVAALALHIPVRVSGGASAGWHPQVLLPLRRRESHSGDLNPKPGYPQDLNPLWRCDTHLGDVARSDDPTRCIYGLFNGFSPSTRLREASDL